MTTLGLTPVTLLDCALRVAMALALGSAIGIERQWRQRMAGLRTNALVAVGSCLFILITPLVGSPASSLQIASYVVSGIGFLAGGVIFKERLSVSGLNTAATLWCTAAIGSLVGFGDFWVASLGVAAVLVANVVLRPVAQSINRRPVDGTEVVSSYEIRAVCRQDVEERIRTTMISAARGNGMMLAAVSSDDIEATTRVEVTANVTVTGRPDAKLEKIVTRLGVEAGVVAVSWKIVPTTDDERAMVTE